jgi:hypothetical protein
MPIIPFKSILYKPSNIDWGVIKNASKTNSYIYKFATNQNNNIYREINQWKNMLTAEFI